MNELDQKIKDEIIKQVEYIFEPVNGKVISFENPYSMYCCVRSPYSTEDIFSEENKTTIYPLVIQTNLGELKISLQSTSFSNIKLAIGTAYSYADFHQKNKVPNDISLEIQKRVYLDK